MSGAAFPLTMAHELAVTPPRRRRTYVPNSRSSDILPSPSELLPKKLDTRLKTGSRAVALPHNAPVSFQSTSTLVKYNILNLQQELENRTTPERSADRKRSETKAKAKVKPTPEPKETDVDEDYTDESKKPKQKPVKVLSEKPKKSRKRKSEDKETSAALGQFAPTVNKPLTLETGKESATILPQDDILDVSKSRKRRKLDQDRAIPGGASDKHKANKRPIKRTKKKSSHFELQKGKPTAALPQEEPVSIQIEEAVPRGKDWTPPKSVLLEGKSHRGVSVYEVPSSPLKEVPVVSKLNSTEPRKDFGYDRSGSISISPARQIQSSASLAYGRRIDLIPNLGPQSQAIINLSIHEGVVPTIEHDLAAPIPALQPLVAKESKKVSPRKVPGGITGRSIARYAQQEPVAAEPVTALSPHFAPVFHQPALPEMGELEQPTEKTAKSAKARRPRTKAQGPEKESKKKRRTSTKAKSKAVVFVIPKLISPKQHDSKLKRQDLLFGTSSQLRQNDSPTYVRQIQQALRESELAGVQQPDEGSSSPIPLRLSEAVRRTSGRLWAESAHEGDDWHRISDFEDSECVPHIDATEKASDGVLGVGTEAKEGIYNTSEPIRSESATVSRPRESSPVASNGFWLTKGSLNNMPPKMGANPLIIASDSKFNASPSRIVLRQLSTNTKSPTKHLPDNKTGHIAPDAVSGKTSVITKPAAAAAGKRPRGRPRKDVLSEQPLSPTKQRGRPRKASLSSPGQQQTPKKRGRPPKPRDIFQVTPNKATNADSDGSSEFQHIDDIEDSEVDHTPSPPRRHRPNSDSPPLPLSTSTETEAVSKRASALILNDQHPRWPEVKAQLFAEIIAAVKSTPPSGDVKKPSWHEKMLLYDPIVLEDFTAWLNERGLRIEGKNNTTVEISCWMAQSWCETNSICCLWKEGLRGGVRVKY